MLEKAVDSPESRFHQDLRLPEELGLPWLLSCSQEGGSYHFAKESGVPGRLQAEEPRMQEHRNSGGAGRTGTSLGKATLNLLFPYGGTGTP